MSTLQYRRVQCYHANRQHCVSWSERYNHDATDQHINTYHPNPESKFAKCFLQQNIVLKSDGVSNRKGIFLWSDSSLFSYQQQQWAAYSTGKQRPLSKSRWYIFIEHQQSSEHDRLVQCQAVRRPHRSDSWSLCPQTLANCPQNNEINTIDMSNGSNLQHWAENLQPPSLSRQTYSLRSEEHTSELQSRPHISYAVFCLKKKKKTNTTVTDSNQTK